MPRPVARLGSALAPKTGRKAALRKPKKKKSSFSRKISEQVENMRRKALRRYFAAAASR